MDKSIFVEVQESSRKFSAHCYSKKKKEKKSENGLIEEGKRNSFALPESSLPYHSTAQSQERTFWPMISPMRKSESVCVSAQLPQLCEIVPKGPLLSRPIQKTKVVVVWGRAERTAAKALGGHQRDRDRSHYPFLDSIKKPAHKPLATPYLKIPPTTGPWAPTMSREPHPHTHHPMAGSKCTLGGQAFADG